MSLIKLDTALQLIPEYGDDKNTDLQSYIDGVNFVLQNAKTEEYNNYLHVAKIRLKGEIGAAVRRSDIETWNELKEFLRNRIDKQQSESFLEDQLICIKQKPNETIQHFADRIEKIGHKLIIALCRTGIDSKMAELSTERRIHKSFTKGVSEPYKNILLNRKTSSFNDAVKDALMLELEFEEDRALNRRKTFDNDRCYKCHSFGHKAINCRKNTRDVKLTNSKPVTCYNCGKPGHFARDCRRKYNKQFIKNQKPFYNNRSETMIPGNDMRLPSTSRNGGSVVTKSGDYKAMTKCTYN